MKFGNYNISTVPKERTRKFDVFRFSKLKSTTNNFVGRFHSKIETFRRLKSRSESPLSFRASLFERDTLFSRPMHEKFSPKDFPKNHFREDNFYMFGNTIRKLSVNQKTISGKNNYLGENFYCTLRSDGDRKQSKRSQRDHMQQHQHRDVRTIERKITKTTHRQCDALDQSSSGIGSYIEKEIDLNNVNNNTMSRRYTTSLKDILDTVSHLDEDTEFKVLKEYFETNSYSDIIKDSAFKDYLNKKNYGDILDYLNEESIEEGTMRTRLRTPRPSADDSMYDNATDTSKLYKSKSTGNLYESLSSYNTTTAMPINGCGYQTIDRLETGTYRRQRKPPTFVGGSTTSLNRRTNSKIFQRQREREREQYMANAASRESLKFSTNYRDTIRPMRPLPCKYTNPTLLSSSTHQRYDDMKRFCELFLNEHFAFNNKVSTIDTTTLAKRYTERQYKKLISKFVKSKGFVSADEYVQSKFGTILDRSIPRTSYNHKNEKLDLPKTYLDNVERRYYLTKQHFLAAERMRTAQLHPSHVSYSLNDLSNYYTHSNAKRSSFSGCRSAIERCTGGCMTTGRSKTRNWAENCATNSTGSLPSTFRRSTNATTATTNQRHHRNDCYARRSFDHSTCDIYCNSCMTDYFSQIPYRREYYNVSNSYYDYARGYSRSREQQQQQQQKRRPQQHRIQYNPINASTTLRSNYGYRDQIRSEEMASLVPPGLHGKEDVLFGNLNELYTFHSDVFLKDLENCISTTELVALCFVQRRDTFYRLYSFYCQNIPRSERLRETLVDTHLFLQECQKRLGHKLPLAAYLLKPVQRITKYQLLLKDLLRFSDSGTCAKELQKALDCMLIVLKCVNDSMHQIAITGFPADLTQQGELLLQDSFQVWTDKKDIRLRLKTQQRHIFLYQKAMLFCKQGSKTGHNKSTYQFKHYVKMSLIGLTESVRGDARRFEIWLQGRQEVHTIQAATVEIKNKWVAEIKKVLLNQLEELKDEKIKQYGLSHSGANPSRALRQTVSWDTPMSMGSVPQRNNMSCDIASEANRCSNISDESVTAPPAPISSSSSEQDNHEANAWSSDYSNSEDEFPNLDDSVAPDAWKIFVTPLNTKQAEAQRTPSTTAVDEAPRNAKSNSTFYVSVD